MRNKVSSIMGWIALGSFQASFLERPTIESIATSEVFQDLSVDERMLQSAWISSAIAGLEAVCHVLQELTSLS